MTHTQTQGADGAGTKTAGPGDLLYRSEWETTRTITHDEAHEIARRLIASHFNRTDCETARASIPANPDRDDDLLINSYIKQQARKDAATPAPRTDGGMTAGEGRRPIKDAPKDGTRLLCLTILRAGKDKTPEWNIGHYDHAAGGWFSEEGSDIHPTDFYPLPDWRSATPAQPAGAVPDGLREAIREYGKAEWSAGYATGRDGAGPNAAAVDRLSLTLRSLEALLSSVSFEDFDLVAASDLFGSECAPATAGVEQAMRSLAETLTNTIKSWQDHPEQAFSGLAALKLVLGHINEALPQADLSDTAGVIREESACAAAVRLADAEMGTFREAMKVDLSDFDVPATQPAGQSAGSGVDILAVTLAEFQRRNGYHKREIEELLTEFGELLLSKVATAPDSTRTGQAEADRQALEQLYDFACTHPNAVGEKAREIDAAYKALAARPAAPEAQEAWRSQAADEIDAIADLWSADGRSYAKTIAAILRAEEPEQLPPADAETKRQVQRAWDRFKAGTSAPPASSGQGGR